MSRQIGNRSEAQALVYLQGLGYTRLAQNFYSNQGEIDLVMLDPTNTVVFVEVKYRQMLDDLAFEAVSLRKQRAMIHTAQVFMAEQENDYNGYSFGVLFHNEQEWVWIPDAFDGDI